MALVVGTVIGSGVFKKGKTVAEACPEFGLAISVWILGGILALLGVLTIAEVAVRLPKAGGNYIFLREGYGRWAGFMWGWVDFGIIRTSSIGVLAVMTIESLSDLLAQVGFQSLGRWSRVGLTLGVIASLTLVNIRGTRLGGGVQIFLTLVKVLSLVVIIALPFALLLFGSPTGRLPTTAHMAPIWPTDWGAIDWVKYGAAIVAVQWAYHGWLNITPIAEEVQHPQRNIPLALLGGVCLLIALYVGANIAYYTAMSRVEMAHLRTTPVSTEYFVRLLGNVGGMVASLILMISVLGALNGNILVAPRLLYAMSDDSLAPPRLRALHPTYQTPAIAMLVFSGWAMLLVLGAEVAKEIGWIDPQKQVFDILTDYVVFGATIFETLGVAAIFVLRSKQRELTATLPYRCPGYPWVPLFYVLILSAVLYTMFVGDKQRSEALTGLGFICVGGCVYYLFLRQQKENTP